MAEKEKKQTAEKKCTQSTEQRVPSARRKKRKSNKKQVLAIVIAVALVVVTMVTLLIVNAVRNRRPPELETIRARAEELIEKSLPFNEILFGQGLPTYPRIYEDIHSEKMEIPVCGEEKNVSIGYFVFEDEEHGTVLGYQYYTIYRKAGEDRNTLYDIENKVDIAQKNGDYRFARRVAEQTRGEGAIWHNAEQGYSYYPISYEKELFFYSDSDDPFYDYVRTDTGFGAVEDIKNAAAAIYSQAYWSSVNESVFTGLAISDRDGGTLYPLYVNHVEDDGTVWLHKYNQYKGLTFGRRLYDYDTMQIDKKNSKSTFVVLEIESWLEGKESERTVVRVQLRLENGTWYLDSPTY